METDKYAAWLNLWSIQDSLLQWYRSIFLTSQSILLGFGANVMLNENWLRYFPILMPLAFVMLWLWYAICRQRELDVSFCQFQLRKLEEGNPQIEPIFLSFKEFQKKSYADKKNIVNGKESIQVSLTRLKMHSLPYVFAATWVLLLLSKIIQVNHWF